MNSLRFIRSLHVSSAMRQVTEITNASQFQTLMKSEKPIFVDFYATWCGPCKMVAPFLEKISNETNDVDFYKLDVDDPKVQDVVIALQITAS